MTRPEIQIQKIYFTIGEVADELNVSESAIRYWQSKFDIAIDKSTSGRRLFTAKDVQIFRDIVKMKGEGYTLPGIKKRLKIQGAI